jgi:hypothetical protein
VAFAACSAFGTLGYPLNAAGFPVAMAGRAHTALNLLVFVGAFSAQWGVGLAIDALTARGAAAASAHGAALGGLLGLQVAAFLWFLVAPRLRPARAWAHSGSKGS